MQMLLHAAERADPDGAGVEHVVLARETAASALADARHFIRELTPPDLDGRCPRRSASPPRVDAVGRAGVAGGSAGVGCRRPSDARADGAAAHRAGSDRQRHSARRRRQRDDHSDRRWRPAAVHDSRRRPGVRPLPSPRARRPVHPTCSGFGRSESVSTSWAVRSP
ncbi:hypothetical protein [Microbacterium paulum]